MAIVDGIMYPALHERLYVHDSLTILIARDKELYNTLIKDLRVLRAYLEDISINLQIKVSFADSIDKNTLGENLRKDDVDVALIDEGVFNDKDKPSLVRYTQIVHTKEELKEEIGAFLVGNEIYWNFDSPVWHGTSISRYTLGQGITIKAQEFFDYIQREKLSEKLTARARYLWAKTNLLSYSRDLLTYVLQLRRKTCRRGYNEHQNFSIEINYHLTNFYFLMASAFDIISRFLNEYYSLGINHFSKLALERETMLDGLKKSVPDLYTFLNETENNKWVSWLKRRRNYIAHDGSVGHTSLVKEVQVKLTDKEVSDIVDAQTDWESLAVIMPQTIYDQYRRSAEEMVRLKNDYEVVTEDIMVVESGDDLEIFFPLISIHYDYDKFSQIVDNIMGIILRNPRVEK